MRRAAIFVCAWATGCEAIVGIDDRTIADASPGGGGAVGASSSNSGGAPDAASSTGSGSASVASTGAGGAGSPASCAGWLAADPQLESGVYTLDLGSPTAVYCDMETDGGGWTLAAVCRSEQTLCWVEAAVGILVEPRSASSAKLADTAIRSILLGGEGITRAWWRQSVLFGSTVPPKSAAVFNLLPEPSAWSSGACGDSDPSKVLRIKYTESDGIAGDAEMAALSAEAHQLSFGAEVATLKGGCSCGSNGWSNAGSESCGLVAWSSLCELGPSMSHECISFPEERADVVLWIR